MNCANQELELTLRAAALRSLIGGATTSISWRSAIAKPHLLLRHVIVGVIPIDGGVQSRIRPGILRSGLIHFALDALFFFHFALFHPLHFFLPFLKCRCHSLSSLQSAHGPGRASISSC